MKSINILFASILVSVVLLIASSQAIQSVRYAAYTDANCTVLNPNITVSYYPTYPCEYYDIYSDYETYYVSADGKGITYANGCNSSLCSSCSNNYTDTLGCSDMVLESVAEVPSVSAQDSLVVVFYINSTCDSNQIAEVDVYNPGCKELSEGAYLTYDCNATSATAFGCIDSACTECSQLFSYELDTCIQNIYNPFLLSLPNNNSFTASFFCGGYANFDPAVNPTTGSTTGAPLSTSGAASTTGAAASTTGVASSTASVSSTTASAGSTTQSVATTSRVATTRAPVSGDASLKMVSLFALAVLFMSAM